VIGKINNTNDECGESVNNSENKLHLLRLLPTNDW
jgi:hypothetical protein